MGVGIVRLENLEAMGRDAVANGVEGDFMECGVWRGGASIYAKAVLNVLGEGHKRKVFVVDSFQGLPKASDSSHVGGDLDMWGENKYFVVSKEDVMTNFKAFGLLDDNVHFVKGYFKDSLPPLVPSLSKIAVLRLDGDMYSSTMDELFNLYRFLSVNGKIIIDDWSIAHCRQAVLDFRSWFGITEEVVPLPDG